MYLYADAYAYVYVNRWCGVGVDVSSCLRALLLQHKCMRAPSLVLPRAATCVATCVYVNCWLRVFLYIWKYIYIILIYICVCIYITRTEATAVRLLWALRHLWAAALHLYLSCLLPGKDKEEESIHSICREEESIHSICTRQPTARVSAYNVCFLNHRGRRGLRPEGRRSWNSWPV